MKKLFSLLMMAFLALTFVACTNDDTRTNDKDTYPVAYDVTENFQNTNGKYIISKKFQSAIPTTDVILVYRKYGTDNGNPIWQQIPRTLFLNEGELDYDFDFTRNDVAIYAGGNITFANQTATWQNTYLNNQTFRIVFVPASAGKANVDYSNYNEVVKFYNINESKIKTLP